MIGVIFVRVLIFVLVDIVGVDVVVNAVVIVLSI